MLRPQFNPGFAPKVETWNRTFTMPFHVFRHHVRDRANLAVRGALCTEWEAIPHGALVVPSDDDDWFAPDLVQALEDARDPAAAGYYWISTYVEVPRDARHRRSLLLNKLFPWRQPHWTCSSNNRRACLNHVDGVRRPTIERATLVRKYHAYRRLYAKEVPPGVEW
ncbi:MAG TPA: hypothetical protein VNK41_00640 [Vicinamibacterales bacterium]|nr:hypothetical protein [Vicinamibacterales bacterium]